MRKVQTSVAVPNRNRMLLYFECITEFDTELLLGVGLIHASWTHQTFMHLPRIYEPHPLVEVQRYSMWKSVMRLKYAME